MKEVSKWAGLVAAIWVQSFAGNSAAYANYSSKLKSVLTLTQVQLNYLALCKDLGENVGILAGLVCNKVPPWVILSVAALEGLLGFGSLWLVASGTISPRPLWQVTFSSLWIYTKGLFLHFEHGHESFVDRESLCLF
ncbi:hypothetical protein L7F22_039674 [Adiantum nelumboides]|nr:hypothetical protein [Adiantum nelumboides]